MKVNGKDDIPYIMGKKHVPNHQPDQQLLKSWPFAFFFTRSRSPDHQIMSPTWCCHQLLIDRNGILLSQEGNGLTCDGRCKRGLILRTGGQAFPEINEVWDDDDDDDDEYYYY